MANMSSQFGKLQVTNPHQLQLRETETLKERHFHLSFNLNLRLLFSIYFTNPALGNATSSADITALISSSVTQPK